MKTKFVGTVNGVEYNNVKEYNDAVNKVLEAGENLEASSRTETVEDDEENTCNQCKNCSCCEDDKLAKDMEIYLTTVDLNEDLDGTVNDDSLISDVKAAYSIERAKEIAADIKKRCSEEQQNGFIKDVVRTIKTIDGDIQKNNAATEVLNEEVSDKVKRLTCLREQITKVQRELNNIRSKQAVLRNAKTVLDIERAHFGAMIKPIDNIKESIEPTTTIEEKAPQEESVTYEQMLDSYKGIKKLLDEIIGL